MHNFRVFYKDKQFRPYEVFGTHKSYSMSEAKDIADTLELMGCYDFEFRPDIPKKVA